MSKITNEEFEQARNNQDNKNIIHSACNQYRDLLSEDVLESCGLNGLWMCLENHDDNLGSKFTTSLYQFVTWQCKGQVSKMHTGQNELMVDIVDERMPILDRMIIHEYIEKLPSNYREVIYGKFFDGKSCAEIAREFGCTRENIRQLLARALSCLRKLYFE